MQEVIQQLYADCYVIPDQEKIFLEAVHLREKYKFSYWDSLIVAAALTAGCDSLFSEDMQHGQVVAGTLMLINPFQIHPAKSSTNLLK